MFLDHARKYGHSGFLLALNEPIGVDAGITIPPASDDTIDHFVAYFPEAELAVDWTARQFWHDAPVPLILTKQNIHHVWKSTPYGFEDADIAESP